MIMASIGRNEPCACGSGKKYKNCHWKVDQFKNIPITELPKPIAFKTLINTYNYLPILKFLASLQLNGLNHGHEEFFEKLSRKGLLKRTKTKTFASCVWSKL